MSFYKHTSGKCIQHKFVKMIEYKPDTKNGGWTANYWDQCKDCGLKK